MTDVRQADLGELLDAPSARGEVAPLHPRTLPGVRGQRDPDALRRPRVAIRWRSALLLVLLLLPTIVTGLYYGFVASDRYVSTASFVVRTAAKPAGDSGIGAFLRMAGIGRAEDDTYSVKNFIESRDAVHQMQSRIPLAEIYGREGADLLSRYPSVLYGPTNEELFHFYNRMTSVAYSGASGITTLSVQAFRPDDALLVAKTVLDLAENLVNQLNSRIHQDAVVSAEQEVAHEEQRLTEAQVAVTTFQNRETMIDPASNSALVTTIVGKLQGDLAQVQARIADMKTASPNNPALPAMERQAGIVRSQIEREASRVTTSQEGLADKLGQYQRLVLEREFATKALALATTALDGARTDARRKQLYIERIVEPNLTDKATLPLRGWTTFTVLAVNLLALFLGWLLTAGVKEHIRSTR